MSRVCFGLSVFFGVEFFMSLLVVGAVVRGDEGGLLLFCSLFSLHLLVLCVCVWRLPVLLAVDKLSQRE